MHRFGWILFAVLTACSGGGGGGGSSASIVPPPVVNDSAGGIWRGVRPNGTEIVVLISEVGEFRTLDPFGNQGFGLAVVTNQNEISIDYSLVAPFNNTIIDGSESADCELSGSFQERVSLNYDNTCMTEMGNEFAGAFALTYDPVYDNVSSIARVVGSYDDEGDVLTIDANGALFAQSAEGGCVSNGQVSIIDSAWNLYAVQFTMESCQGEDEPLNGVPWSGLATLLSIDGADVILGGFTAEVGGRSVSLVVAIQRI
jgi:hypothetical protein